MNAPGSPSSPLQMTYFPGPRRRGPRPISCPVGKPAPPRPRRPLASHFVDDLLGRKPFQAMRAGPGTRRAAGTRPDRSDRSGRSTRWPGAVAAQESADRCVADVDGMALHRIGDLVGQQAVQPARSSHSRSAAHSPLGLELRSTMIGRRLRHVPWRKVWRAASGRHQSPPAAFDGTCPRSRRS